ncbi:hypothetical protein C900_02390 [Fulvivirga imtechensis AK7]|uniref:Histidine phosphatase family protein n=1 Tax=Fulvivirga imtechensis AK7 TaxID=1237149 RepID=L8JVL3_9BACT|nr:histidine phosphatase family protein [Fulvivirga imtechensis]ELR71654.1 hypothetical protein C900_02390 [Fulvivirga imtechensis AK7]
MSEEIPSIKDLKLYYSHQQPSSCVEIFNDAANRFAQIILIRHGEPELERVLWYNRRKIITYSKKYDLVGVKPFEVGPICTENLENVKVYHSTLPRAQHTAELIFGSRFQMIPDSRFREFEKRIIPFLNIHLPLKFWTVVSRVLWYFGFNSREIENVKQAKLRTRANADFLAKEAQLHRTVMVVAHGFHNRYVSKYLRKNGWHLVRKGGRSYLGVNILATRVKQAISS